jgi:hypothetical protein
MDKLLKVFLVRFADLHAPRGYTRAYFVDYFFGARGVTSSPEGNPVDGGVFDYFFGLSGGRACVSGDVVDWTDNPLPIAGLGHFDDATLSSGNPRLLGGIVAPTLHARGIRTLGDVRIRGRIPDGLVFCHVGVWGGGVPRTMAQVKANLKADRRMDLWDRAWDDWIEMPIVTFACCAAEPPPTARSDGTFARAPALSDLQFSSPSVLHYTLAPLLFGSFEPRSQIYGTDALFEAFI